MNADNTREEYPRSLDCLFTGLSTGLDPFDSEPRKPIWYDDVKVEIGQKFAKKHFASIEYAQMLSLMVLFSFGENTKPLLFTRKSHTVEAAQRRYLSTALKVLSWYEGDLWEELGEAAANFLHVRFLHEQVSEAMSRLGRPSVDEITNLHYMLTDEEILCYSVKYLKQDFLGSCPSYVNMTGSSPIFINQAEMSFTLFGFMGLTILYPEYFGIHGATVNEFEGFVHLWRVIGHRLGIHDRFNFCAGSLSEVKARCHDVIHLLFVPNLVSLGEEWEHLSRSVGDICQVREVREDREKREPLPSSGSTVTTKVGRDLVFRLERQFLTSKRAKTKKVSTTTTETIDELPSIMEDYADLGQDDDLVRKIESDYQWSVVGRTPPTEDEMNRFVDDYVQQDYQSEVTHKASTVALLKKHILNIVITDMSDNKTTLISNKNYTW
ncbi:hypothetical protein GE061_013020 [Apolygus lucorum]|uniref:ER-bound oxygenase mpaB/mpaB'/Rubber oxygenase catalytic domain-containing protein n=1 Tax=Apolygus lucorum TaxID=248454 RepID=A0A8S9XU87_APOLU|nr:hypothetical protein GE061_013020 [Apolygus lucorum]